MCILYHSHVHILNNFVLYLFCYTYCFVLYFNFKLVKEDCIIFYFFSIYPVTTLICIFILKLVKRD